MTGHCRDHSIGSRRYPAQDVGASYRTRWTVETQIGR